MGVRKHTVFGLYISLCLPFVEKGNPSGVVRVSLSEVDPQLAAVLDALPVPVVLLDGRGRVSWGNAAGGQACGRSLDDIRGRPFWELAPAVAGGARAAAEAVLAGHGPRSIDGAREMSSRETKPLHWHLAAIANGTGEIAQVVATAREDDAPSASSRGAPEAAIEPVHSMTRYLGACAAERSALQS